MPNFWNELERERRAAQTGEKVNPLDRFVEALRDAFPELAEQTPRAAQGDVAVTAAQAVVDLGGPGHTKEEVAEAIADRLSPEDGGHPLSLPLVLKEMSEKLERMGQIMGGVSRQFGSSGPSNIADNPSRELGKVEVKNFPDFKIHDSASADAIPVSPNTWTQVVEVTLTVPAIVTGYGIDPASVTALGINYRERLVVGGTVKQIEGVASNAVSWVPVEVSVFANTVIRVEAIHAEALAVNFSGSLAWRES